MQRTLISFKFTSHIDHFSVYCIKTSYQILSFCRCKKPGALHQFYSLLGNSTKIFSALFFHFEHYPFRYQTIQNFKAILMPHSSLCRSFQKSENSFLFLVFFCMKLTEKGTQSTLLFNNFVHFIRLQSSKQSDRLSTNYKILKNRRLFFAVHCIKLYKTDTSFFCPIIACSKPSRTRRPLF